MSESIRWAGYRWLLAHYGLRTTQPLAVETRLGAKLRSVVEGGTEQRTILEASAPVPEPAAQLAFALKHEGVHLEALARIFAQLPASVLEAWVAREPTGQYARRAGFFYEWLTGDTLHIAPLTMGNYVDALDASEQLVSAAPTKLPRWRVRNNLLGTAALSPQVRLTPAVRAALGIDLGQEIAALEGRFGHEILQRSAAWLTAKESRSSFAIEHEENRLDRIQRFARVLAEETGKAVEPLATETLLALQNAILGADALHYGIRRSPVFVGERRGWGEEVVHYIAPHWDDAPALLTGLSAVLGRTAGLSPVARAAIVSFAFVYIHPLVDGNGRISRFLINDIFRRDGAVAAPNIVPISASLQNAGLRPLSYDAALEVFSSKLLAHYREQWRFGAQRRGADGIDYNLEFDGYRDALPAWRYLDMTEHVAFLGTAVLHSIRVEMREEALYLQQHDAARARLKEVLEGPNADLDRIIRSVREQQGQVSGALKKQFPRLADEHFAALVVAAVLGTTDPR